MDKIMSVKETMLKAMLKEKLRLAQIDNNNERCEKLTNALKELDNK